MKLSCLRKNLLFALGQVIRIVGAKVSLPILSNVLLSSEKGRLKISATDLELGINVKVGAKIEKNGSITLPARLLGEFINAVPDEKININVVDKKATISGKGTSATVRGLDAADFPLIPEIKKPLVEIKMSAQKLKSALERVGFACAIDETKPALSGVMFKIKKEELVLAATDSFRLSEQRIEGIKGEEAKEFIVPKRTVGELARIIGDTDGEINIKISANQVSYEFDNIYFISRLIEGSFPDYTQIIPKTFNTTIIIDKNKFIQALKAASLFSRDAANNVAINIDEKLCITASSQQLGEGNSEVFEIKREGKKNKFSVNAMFLLECLNIVDEEKVELKIVDAGSPILVKPQKNTKYFFLVMPLKQE